MSRTILIVALVAALIGGVATYTIQAATQTAESEVRISAQRLDSGRVEFGLQQRQPDGEWGERLLPELRFFPATGFVNHWANSSPLTITSQIEDPPAYINDTQPSRTLDLAGYLEFCSDSANQGGGGLELLGSLEDGEVSLTWGLIFTGVDSDITTLRSVEPPPELAELHQAQIELLTTVAAVAYGKPADDPANPFELLLPALAGLPAVLAADANLDPQVRQQLVDAGCLDPQGEDGGGGSEGVSQP